MTIVSSSKGLDSGCLRDATLRLVSDGLSALSPGSAKPSRRASWASAANTAAILSTVRGALTQAWHTTKLFVGSTPSVTVKVQIHGAGTSRVKFAWPLD